ncbi:MAG: hypothetical protein EXQ47_00480 [Bryobacterales bacterium]|nr:hypothetical protein [Bryobacterales bacterium]
MQRFYYAMTAMLIIPALAAAQQKTAGKPDGERAHPDLSGLWAYTIGLPPAALKKEANGSVAIKEIDRGLALPKSAPVLGALASTPAPSYKPEFQAKVKNLFDNESKLEPVFYCGKPGVPRVGPPRKIVQLPGEMIFFYEDISGDPYRIIPTGGRTHRANGNPSAYGDSVAHWEGGTLVVDVTNFVDDTWFGEGGYLHTDAMRVTERLWRVGPNLAYQVTVADPKVLTAPWTLPARLVKPSTDPLEESPKCVEDDGHRLLNNDHHGQR